MFLQNVGNHLGERLDHMQHVVFAALVRAFAPGEDFAAKRDGGDRVPVDAQIDTDHAHVLARLHDVTGSPASAGAHGSVLNNQAQLGKSGGQVTDSAAIEAEVLGQGGARNRTVQMHFGQEPSHVVAPEFLWAQRLPQRTLALFPVPCLCRHALFSHGLPCSPGRRVVWVSVSCAPQHR